MTNKSLKDIDLVNPELENDALHRDKTDLEVVDVDEPVMDHVPPYVRENRGDLGSHEPPKEDPNLRQERFSKEMKGM